MKIKKLIKRFFGKKEEPKIEFTLQYQLEKDPETDENEVWFDFEKKKPGHEVVLASIDTYDCGWVIDTAWWNQEKKCWMSTGGASGSEPSGLAYTHWRRLPKGPDGNFLY